MSRNVIVIEHDTAEIKLIAFADAGKVVCRYGLVVHTAQRHRNIFFVDINLAACLNEITNLCRMIRMTVRNVQIDIVHTG